MTSRREFLQTSASLVGGVAASHLAGLTPHAEPPDASATPPTRGRAQPTPWHAGADPQDEAYWRDVAAQYDITDEITNLEAGYFGMMARPVLAAYERHIRTVNRASSYFARRTYPALAEASRRRAAEAVGVDPAELVFSRNATEALQALIGQYNRLRAGDTVLYADLDYPAMQQALVALAERRGATVARIDLPEPASADAVIAAYEAAFAAHPRLRLLLLTHVNNKTGLIHPVRAIADRAAARGIDVIVDAAHSVGQVPLALPDLGAPYVGINLHKWVGAPVGVGAMYIRGDALGAIDRAHGDDGPLDRIESRLHTGTTDFAAVMTVPDALDFQASIGVARKAARLRALRDRWVTAARAIEGVDILTPDEPGSVGAITGFRVHGRGEPTAIRDLVRTLHDEFRIFTVQRSGIARGDCVRVTPALYNSPSDVDRLVGALRTIAARG